MSDWTTSNTGMGRGPCPDCNETKIARITKERDALREALARCPQYILLAIIDAKSTGKMTPESIAVAERDLEAVDKALSTLDEG